MRLKKPSATTSRIGDSLNAVPHVRMCVSCMLSSPESNSIRYKRNILARQNTPVYNSGFTIFLADVIYENVPKCLEISTYTLACERTFTNNFLLPISIIHSFLLFKTWILPIYLPRRISYIIFIHIYVLLMFWYDFHHYGIVVTKHTWKNTNN